MAGAPERVVRVRIDGRVQGVGFRAWTMDEASRRQLRGWVRNRADGSVEALFAGPAESVDAMIDACRQGPRHARVDIVEVAEGAAAAPAGQPGGFVLRSTE